MTEVTAWSETDASNNGAAPAGAPESMAPSGVNDTIRAMFGGVARAYNRLTGKYASTGSANAYVLTPTGALTAYVTGERYTFRANFANTDSASLNISALGAKTIKKMGTGGKENLASGDIQSGQPVTVEYDGTDMVMVTPIAGVSALPPGILAPFAGSTAPSGWLLCYGQAVSRTTYAALFTAIGTTHGAGDASTTFNLPDLRGRSVSGKDDMGGTAINRITSAVSGITGTTLGAVGGSQSHTLTTSEMPAHTHTYISPLASGTATVGTGGNFGSAATGSTGGGGAHNNMQPTIILNWIIKT